MEVVESQRMEIPKPVAIILSGPSAVWLEDNMEKLLGWDVLWGSLNRFSFIQKNIMDKHGKKLDLVYCGSRERFAQEKENIQSFEGALFTDPCMLLYLMSQNTTNYLPKHVELCTLGTSTNSLLCFIMALLSRGGRRIYLFGADGGKMDKMYYRQEEQVDDFKQKAENIQWDTDFLNKHFESIVKYWHYPPHFYKITNVTENSHLTCFENMGYDEFLATVPAKEETVV